MLHSTTRYNYTSFGALSLEDGPWTSDTVNYSYANRLRTGLSLDRPSASPLALTYGYDAATRLTTISSGAGSFSYLYDPTLKLHVSRTSLPNGAYVTNTFDANAQLTGTYLKNNSDVVLNSHAYLYTGGDYREVTRQTRTDGSYIDYGYDGISQLTSALGKEAGGTTNRLNEQFRYSYDKAGNLRSRTNNLFEHWFNVSSLDQLATVTRSNTLTVVGTTSSGATNVTVNGSNAVRYADNTFAKDGFTLTNSGVNVFTAVAKDGYGRTDSNTVSPLLYSLIGMEYDGNGNMTFDGSSDYYEYDDENQLTAVYANTYPLTWRSEFVYDGKMRRRICKEFTFNGSVWVQTNEVRYIYDGNLVIQERDALNAPVVTYTRGKDLSGPLEGAGGIGGLLARTDDRNRTTAFYHADRLGNVTMLINAQQIPVAKYLYDPFGNTLSASGPLADANLYRFSSKEWHPTSGLVYYLYRFYIPNLQRWPNRDPIEEEGGANLYGFVFNQPVSRLDPFGLDPGTELTAAIIAGDATQIEAVLTAYEGILSDAQVIAARSALQRIAARAAALAAAAECMKQKCDQEWLDARKKCAEELAKPNPSKGLTGGYTDVEGCAKGWVSELCGGNRKEQPPKKKRKAWNWNF